MIPKKYMNSLSTGKSNIAYTCSDFAERHPELKASIAAVIDIGHDGDDFGPAVGIPWYHSMDLVEAEGIIATLEPEGVRARYLRSILDSLHASHIDVARGSEEKEVRVRLKGIGADIKPKMSCHVEAPAKYELECMERFIESQKRLKSQKSGRIVAKDALLDKFFVECDATKVFLNTAGMQAITEYARANPGRFTKQTVDHFVNQCGAEVGVNDTQDTEQFLNEKTKELQWRFVPKQENKHLIHDKDSSNHKFNISCSECLSETLEREEINSTSCFKTPAFQTRLTLKDYEPLLYSGHAAGQTIYDVTAATLEKFYKDSCHAKTAVQGDWKTFIGNRTWWGMDYLTERMDLDREAEAKTLWSTRKTTDPKAPKNMMEAYDLAMKAHLTKGDVPPTFETIKDHNCAPQYDLWALKLCLLQLAREPALSIFHEKGDGTLSAMQTLDTASGCHRNFGLKDNGGLNPKNAEEYFKAHMEAPLLIANEVERAISKGEKTWCATSEDELYTHVGFDENGEWKYKAFKNDDARNTDRLQNLSSRLSRLSVSLSKGLSEYLSSSGITV